MKSDEDYEFSVEVPGRGYVGWAGNLVEPDVTHCLSNIEDALKMLDSVQGRYRAMGCPEIADTIRVVRRKVVVTRHDWGPVPMNGEQP